MSCLWFLKALAFHNLKKKKIPKTGVQWDRIVTLIQPILRMKLIFIPLLPSSSSRIPTFIGCLPSEVKQIFVPARLNLCLPWSCHAHLLLSPSMKALRGMPDSAAFQTYLYVPNIKQKSQSLFTFTVCTVLDSIVILFFFFLVFACWSTGKMRPQWSDGGHFLDSVEYSMSPW